MEWTLEEDILRHIDYAIQQAHAELEIIEDVSEYSSAQGKIKGLIMAQGIIKNKFKERS